MKNKNSSFAVNLTEQKRKICSCLLTRVLAAVSRPENDGVGVRTTLAAAAAVVAVG